MSDEFMWRWYSPPDLRPKRKTGGVLWYSWMLTRISASSGELHEQYQRALREKEQTIAAYRAARASAQGPIQYSRTLLAIRGKAEE